MIGYASLLLLAVQSTFTVTNSAYNGPVKRPANARLVWRDEFNGTALDPQKWRYDTAYNKQGWFNGELQYYSAGRPRNIRLENGRLVIAAHREALKSAPDWGGQNYTSGKIVSKRAWTYGFYEVRAKLPAPAAHGRRSGCFPSIWRNGPTMARSTSWSRSVPSRT